jgi:hypothetical protein
MAPLIVKLDAATYSFCIADANIDQRRLQQIHVTTDLESLRKVVFQ